MGAPSDYGAIRLGTLGTHLSFFAAGVRGATLPSYDALPSGHRFEWPVGHYL